MSAGAERGPRRVGEDVIVALDRPAEMLTVKPEAMLDRDAAEAEAAELLDGAVPRRAA